MKTKEDVITEIEYVLERIKYWDINIDCSQCFSGPVESGKGDDVFSVRNQLLITWVQPIYEGG